MEASKRVRASEGFICHLLVLSALPSHRHADRPGIPDKKRARRNILLNRMFVLVPQRWTLGAKFPKRKVQPPYAWTRMRCDAFLPNAVRIDPSGPSSLLT